MTVDERVAVAMLGALDAVAERVAARVAELLARGEPADAPPALIDAPGLARELGVSVATVRRMSRAGAIPIVRVGDAPRYRLAAVLAALGAGDCAPRPISGESYHVACAPSSEEAAE